MSEKLTSSEKVKSKPLLDKTDMGLLAVGAILFSSSVLILATLRKQKESNDRAAVVALMPSKNSPLSTELSMSFPGCTMLSWAEVTDETCECKLSFVDHGSGPFDVGCAGVEKAYPRAEDSMCGCDQLPR